MPQDDESVVLAVQGLGFSFGAKRVLDGIDLTLRAGEFKLLLGPNGAGKTTLFSLITRLYDSADGGITVAGHDLRRHAGQALRRIRVVVQPPRPALYLTLRRRPIATTPLPGLLGARPAGYSAPGRPRRGRRVASRAGAPVQGH